jgi:hypothetical protein
MKGIYFTAIAMLLSSPALADSLDLNGDWICSQFCLCGEHSGRKTQIAQDGTRFIFTNECGVSISGSLVPGSTRTIIFDTSSVKAIASLDGNKLTFDNGAVWTRQQR